MNLSNATKNTVQDGRRGWWLLLAAFALTLAIYWPGLSGGYLFDDYPNIVDNKDVQPSGASTSLLVAAALSSPSSEFKRPLASLSFAANYLVTGLDPYWMKLTNLVIHLLNGLLVFVLARILLRSTCAKNHLTSKETALIASSNFAKTEEHLCTTSTLPLRASYASADPIYGADLVAALIAAGWMLLPINLTAVLYVVQRMESLANLFVLLGLTGYVAGRRKMLALDISFPADLLPRRSRGFLLCISSLIVPTALGLLAKETAVMLPLYALLVEWVIFRFRAPGNSRDRGVAGLFLLVLVLPMLVGLAWLLPQILSPSHWAARNFTLSTRLLSETRIVVDYVGWILLPTPSALSFYHDDFQISTGLLAPWTTLASVVLLAGLIVSMFWLRNRRPLAALGIALFIGCQLMTGTILPLELIYEHRNYFASFGLLLAIVPLLAVSQDAPFALPRNALLVGLMLCWMGLTALTTYTWGSPLRLAEDLATRAPQSPRAQYELGRTYIIYSHYDPASPFTKLAYAPLEKAASLPNASILPEQALIFMNARMHLPLKDAWWDSLIAKLRARKPGVQDESSLGALTQCAHDGHCDLPRHRMVDAYLAALSHPAPSARLLAMYGDYAWNILGDHDLGLLMTADAVKASPSEPAYHITLIRMLAAQGRITDAQQAIKQLEALNIGGRLNASLAELHTLLDTRWSPR